MQCHWWDLIFVSKNHTHIHLYVCVCLCIKICLEKVKPLLIYQKWFAQHPYNLVAKESGLECACVNNDNFTVLVSRGGRQTPLSKHGYCVPIAFKRTEWVEQQICIKFCDKLEHSSTKTIQKIQKAFRDDAMSAAHVKV